MFPYHKIISGSKLHVCMYHRDLWFPPIDTASAAVIFQGIVRAYLEKKHRCNHWNPNCLPQWNADHCRNSWLNYKGTGWLFSESHPDAAVTDGGRVCRALCVDVGLWIMNSTFHLQQRTVMIREGEERNNIYNRWVLGLLHITRGKKNQIWFAKQSNLIT